jgi:hypothetical protein
MADPNSNPSPHWNRMYVLVLLSNGVLVILFFLLRYFFNIN